MSLDGRCLYTPECVCTFMQIGTYRIHYSDHEDHSVSVPTELCFLWALEFTVWLHHWIKASPGPGQSTVLQSGIGLVSISLTE